MCFYIRMSRSARSVRSLGSVELARSNNGEQVGSQDLCSAEISPAENTLLKIYRKLYVNRTGSHEHAPLLQSRELNQAYTRVRRRRTIDMKAVILPADSEAGCRKKPAPQAHGRNRRPAHPLAHHEDLFRARHQRFRPLPRLQGLRHQGIFRELLPAHLRRHLRPAATTTIETHNATPSPGASPWSTPAPTP